MSRSWITVTLIAAMALWGCSSVQDDWNKANATNTVAAYQAYLSKHPSSEHTAAAEERIRSLQDEEAWSQAKQSDTAQAYRDYLQKQPTGAHATEAQSAATAAERSADWKTAEATGTAAAYQDFLKKYATGTEADQARQKLTDLAGYKVQLAAVKTEKQARQQQQRLRSKYGDVLHDVLVVPTNSGKSYALESAPMSESQANSACGELKKAHQSCEVIKSDTGKG